MSQGRSEQRWRSPEVSAWDDDGPSLDMFLAGTDLSALGTQLPPASANHRPRRVTPLPQLAVSKGRHNHVSPPHKNGKNGHGHRQPTSRAPAPITYTDRFRVGLEHRKMITSRADDRWVSRLLTEATAAVNELPPTSIAPGEVDARRLGIFSNAFDIFISRQPHHLVDTYSSIKAEYDGYIKGPKHRLAPLANQADAGAAEVNTEELRREIANLEARARVLRAEADTTERQQDLLTAELSALSPPYPHDGDADGDGGDGRGSNWVKGPVDTVDESAEAELGPDCGPIAAMVREMAQVEAEIAKLEATQAAFGVPNKVLGWYDSNKADIGGEIRLIKKQIEVLESAWFEGELQKLNGPPDPSDVPTTGDGFDETTWFTAPRSS